VAIGSIPVSRFAEPARLRPRHCAHAEVPVANLPLAALRVREKMPAPTRMRMPGIQ
jgi:hypothetical protein